MGEGGLTICIHTLETACSIAASRSGLYGRIRWPSRPQDAETTTCGAQRREVYEDRNRDIERGKRTSVSCLWQDTDKGEDNNNNNNTNNNNHKNNNNNNNNDDDDSTRGIFIER